MTPKRKQKNEEKEDVVIVPGDWLHRSAFLRTASAGVVFDHLTIVDGQDAVILRHAAKRGVHIRSLSIRAHSLDGFPPEFVEDVWQVQPNSVSLFIDRVSETSAVLSRCPLTYSGLHKLSIHCSGQSLYNSEPELLHSGVISFISMFRSLRELELVCAGIDQEAVFAFGMSDRLERLALDLRNRVTPKLMQQVSTFAGLKHLDLGGNFLSENALRWVAEASNLESLSLRGCKGVEVKGVRHLLRLTSLKVLDVISCSVVGTREMSVFAGISSLERVHIRPSFHTLVEKVMGRPDVELTFY